MNLFTIFRAFRKLNAIVIAECRGESDYQVAQRLPTNQRNSLLKSAYKWKSQASKARHRSKLASIVYGFLWLRNSSVEKLLTSEDELVRSIGERIRKGK